MTLMDQIRGREVKKDECCPLGSCKNWVCLGAFVDRERVSERTVIQHEEEILGLVLNHKINVRCVVQWIYYGFQHLRS